MLVDKFKETGSVGPRSGHYTENITAVTHIVAEESSKSIYVVFKYSSIVYLKKYLNLYGYKIHLKERS